MMCAEGAPENGERVRGEAAIRVVADHREAGSAAVASLREMEGVELGFDHLEAGDYLA